ncbi:transposase family protein [Streptomyces ardesiacus]|uniref:transposase family protein n=1 Tax=Streptomyces TaxID=1883 RepID=UPI001F38FA01|nr:transposase family protein [Streptomyces sp. NRRL F-4707]
MLALTACAVLAGAASLLAVGEWIADAPAHVLDRVGARPDPLAPRRALLAETTVRRLLARVDDDALDRAVGSWLADRRLRTTGVTTPRSLLPSTARASVALPRQRTARSICSPHWTTPPAGPGPVGRRRGDQREEASRAAQVPSLERRALWKNHATIIAGGDFDGTTNSDFDLLVRWSDGELTVYEDLGANSLKRERKLKPANQLWTHSRILVPGEFGGNLWEDDLFVRWSDGEVTVYGNTQADALGREYQLVPPPAKGSAFRRGQPSGRLVGEETAAEESCDSVCGPGLLRRISADK